MNYLLNVVFLHDWTSNPNSGFSRQTGWNHTPDSDNKPATQKRPIFGVQNPYFYAFRQVLAVSTSAVVRVRTLMLN